MTKRRMNFIFEKTKVTGSPTTVEEYIQMFPEEVGRTLSAIRKTVKKAAPKAEEVISYNMPGYKYNGMLVWFAAFKNHIGFYPKDSGISAFKKELSHYKSAKGSVQFAIDKPIPLNLISDIVKYRVRENLGSKIK